MKILTSEQIREADKYTIEKEPVASIDLMERAATACAEWLINRYDPSESFIIFAGPGNNGGDGWALTRLLAEKGFTNIRFYLLKITDKLSPDSEINRERLISQNIVKPEIINSENDFPALNDNDVIIEGLFGSGLTRPLSGLPAALVKYINRSRSRVISIDIPGGLFGEDNSENDKDCIVTADHTLTFQFPKLSFFFPENKLYVGEWHVLPIGLHPGFIDGVETPWNYITEGEAGEWVKVRDKFSHKGIYGHGLLISGSYGMMGAAILGAKAALRSGIGLVTAHIPALGYEIMQTAVPETIISIDHSDRIFTEVPVLSKYNAIGIGPGLGCHKNSQRALQALLGKTDSPMVIDADALNILSANKEWIPLIPEKSILTPHPKEFERLAGTYRDTYSRIRGQIEFAVKYKLIIVLKGAYTSTVLPDGSCFFNTSGNPGMATAGSGDVLTGIILSLLSQGYLPEYAAFTGVYLHALAGDIAAAEKGEDSLIASDIIDNIGKAYLRLLKNKH